MSFTRSMSRDEKSTISAILRLKPETARFLVDLDTVLVQEMADGGMGSLLLIPKEPPRTSRSFGSQIVAAAFTDSDGVPVSVTLNTDSDGTLYELDVWKVNFAPLLRWPDPIAIRIVE